MDKPSTTTLRLLTHCISARVLNTADNSLIEFMVRGFHGLCLVQLCAKYRRGSATWSP